MARRVRPSHRSRRQTHLLRWLLQRFWGVLEPRPARRPRMVMEGLEQRVLLSADLVPEIGVFVSTDPLLPGVHATVPVTVSNAGADGAPGGSIIRLFASEDAVLDASDPVVGEVALPADALAPGTQAFANVALDLGGLDHAGPYRLIALADATNAIAESDEGNNADVSAAFDVAWQFGNLSGQTQPVALTLANAEGDRFDLTLTGAGRGEVGLDAAGLRLSLQGVDGTTKVTVRGWDPVKRLAVHDIAVDGPLGSLDASGVTLTGEFVAAGNVGTLKFGSVQGASLRAPIVGTLAIAGDFSGDLALTGSGTSGLALGNATVGGAIDGRWNVLGRSGSIRAGSTAATWFASFNEPVTSLTTAGDLGGTVYAPALLQLTVGGDVRNAHIVIGARLGADGALGGAGAAADVFGAGNLNRIRVGGGVHAAVIRVGVDPRNGVFDDGNDTVSAGGKIQELLIAGPIGADATLVAGTLPATARIGNVVVDPRTNPQIRIAGRDVVAPVILGQLANDTGSSGGDRVTSDATVAGQVVDLGGASRLEASFDGNTFTDVSSALLADGRFTLSESLLETVLGGSLADDAYTLRVRAADAAGNTSAVFSLAFTLDTTAPLAPVFDLSTASDTGTPGDLVTSAAKVALVGDTGAGLTVSLQGTNLSALANASGRFQLPDVPLTDGDNVLTLRVRDAAGNLAESVRTISRVGEVQRDVALTWNQIALDAVRLDASAPPMATRALAMVSLAMYDIVSAFDGTPGYLTTRTAPAGASLDAAIAQAAHDVLAYLYPAQRTAFAQRLTESLLPIAAGAAKDAGIAFGQAVAATVIELRRSDGYDAFAPFVDGQDPGEWRATGPMFDVALLPQWKNLTPFALDAGAQYRPDGPPALESAAYAADLNEVKRLGSVASPERTAEQTQIARFWADGLGTFTPPGHWNQIAQNIALAEGNSLAANVRLLARLNVAMADSSIAAWDAKYHYAFWRPVSAIQDAELDGNAATTEDNAWSSLLITPAFPEYVSGHSTYSAAAATILTEIFGEDYAFETTSPGLAGVTRTFTSFDQAAREAGRSRIYGGIHFQFSNEDGLALGTQVAQHVLEAFTVRGDVQPPRVVVDKAAGIAARTANAVDLIAATNPSITGSVIDNLAGVESLQVVLDNGTPGAVAVDALGRFAYAPALPLDGSADGLHTITLLAVDRQGNAAAPVVFTFRLDTRAPVVNLAGLEEGAEITYATRVAGVADATGSSIVELCYAFDGGAPAPIVYNGATGAFDQPIRLSDLEVGAHVLTIVAKDAAGNTTTLTRNVQLAALAPFTVTGITPADGATNIGTTFRPQVFFSRAVNASTLNQNNFYATGPGGQKLAATIVSADDGTFAWLFFANPLPGGASITVHVDGATIRAAADGAFLDADGDRTAGGRREYSFSTVSLTPLANTSLSGIVLDPGPDLSPMTIDDILAGPDGALHTDDDVYRLPLAGVRVFILGLENQAVFTDAQGRFTLPSVPSGTVKVAVDGRTATNAPAGFYFPEMVMDVTLQAGKANTLMDSMGTVEDRQANAGRPEMYLPRLRTEILNTVQADETSTVAVAAASAPDLTDQQRGALTLQIAPNSLIGANGEKLDSAQIGISTVPPELVRDMLPPGVLQHTFDITIQAPGVDRFSTPAPMTFPNVFNAAPGTQLNFLSFDHTTGRLVIEGTATVSADGLTVSTDPGTGITHPGWHGLTPPGECGDGSEDPPPPPEESPEDTENENDPITLPLFIGESGEFPELSWTAPEPLDESLPPPPPPADCPVPPLPEDTENQQQPYIAVTIDVDGPLADFMNATGTLPLDSQSFMLQAGSGETKTFAAMAKSYAELIPGGFESIEENRLYGAKIKVTVETGNPDGSKHTEINTYYLYRFLDVTDKEHDDGKMSFAQTINDGAAKTIRDVPLTILAGSAEPTLTLNSTQNFFLADGLDQVWFDPTQEGNALTSGIEVENPENGDSAGTIDLEGKGVLKQGWVFDSASFETLVKAIGEDDGTKFPTVPASDRALIDTQAERDAILASIATQTAALFSAAALTDGIYQAAAGGAGILNVSFVEGANPVPPATGWGLGGATDALTAADVDLAGLVQLEQDAANYNKYERAFRAAELVNNTLAGNIEFLFDNFFELQVGMDTADEIKFAMGMNNAHEIGHHLGLFHTGTSGTVYVAGGDTDIMRQGLYLADTQQFNLTTEAAKLGLHMKYTQDEVDLALAYYAAYQAARDANPTWYGNAVGDHPEDGGPALAFYLGPTLGVFSGTGATLGSYVDLGDARVDGSGGQSLQSTWTVRNLGPGTLTITDIVVGDNDAVIDVARDLIGVTLGAGESRPLSISFDPTQAGDFTRDLRIVADNGDSKAVELRATGVSTTPSLKYESVDNNFGGVKVANGRIDVAAIGRITNVGAETLVISDISVVEGLGEFALTGFTPGVPVQLATGQSLTIGGSFDPGSVGLRRGEIRITSNDASTPRFDAGIVGTGLPQVLYPEWGDDFIYIDTPDANGVNVLRTVSDAQGRFSFFLPTQSDYHLIAFDPVTGLVSHGYGKTGQSGGGTSLTRNLMFGASTAQDTDFDGLPDDIERAIGSALGKEDTDGDGLSDFTEIQQGLDPLGGLGIPTGVVSAVSLQGTAQGVSVVAATDDAGDLTAYVATGDYGLAVVNASRFTAPTVVGELDLAGFSVDVSVDVDRERVAVAAGSGGLHLIDVSDASSPSLDRTVGLGGGANRVEIRDGIAYVASGSSVVTIDINTGDILQGLEVSSGTITDLAFEGEALFVMTESRLLQAIGVTDHQMVLRDSIALANGGGKLFVGDGVAYVGAEGSFLGGYVTVDVADLDALVLLSEPDNTGVSGRALALNGSGLAVTVGSAGRVNALDVLSVADPADTGAFVTRISLPAAPNDLAIAEGLAFVANGTADLQIVNYINFDTQGIAPTVTISNDAVDVDAGTAGVQVLEGRTFRIDPQILDDVQLRNVELLVNNQVVRNDVSFPWDLFVTAPTIAQGGSTLTVQVRATDTGGNAALSAPLVLTVVPDTFAPNLVSASVAEGARLFFVRSIDLRFDEAIDDTILGGNGMSLVAVGADGQAGTADDVSVPVTIDMRSFGRTVSVIPVADLDPGDYRLRIEADALSDRAGNPIGAPLERAFTIRPASDVRALSGTPDAAQAPSANPGQEIGVGVPFDPLLARARFAVVDSTGAVSTRVLQARRTDPDNGIAYFEVPFDAVTGEISVFQGGGYRFDGVPNWNVTRGSVDLFGPGFNDLLPGNGFYVDLDGATQAAGRLESARSFALLPGQYELTFDLAGSQQFDGDNSVRVTLGSTFDEVFTRPYTDAFGRVTRLIDVTEAGDARLVFDHTGGDNAGLLLDDVQLKRVDSGEVLFADDFSGSFPDGTFVLQIVPVVQAATIESVSSGGTMRIQLDGFGFIEGASTEYRVGGATVLDTLGSTGPDVFSRFTTVGIANGRVVLDVPDVDGAFGSIVVKTAGGVSAPFSVRLEGVEAEALSGEAADGGEASANPGQAVELVGEGLSTASDVLVKYVDSGGTVRTLIVNPSVAAADGRSATLVVPEVANGAIELRVLGSASRPLLQIVPTLSGFDLGGANVRLFGRGLLEGASSYQFLGGSVEDTATGSGPNVVSSGVDNGAVDVAVPVHGLGSVRVVTAGGTSEALSLNYLSPGLGLLRDVAIDPASGQLWVITDHSAAQVHRIDSATGQSLGSFVLSAPTAGVSNFHGGLQVLGTGMNLNGTSVDAGSVLVIQGRSNPDRVVAFDAEGRVLASLALANYDITAGRYDALSGHLFVAAYQGSFDNRVLEIDPANGALIRDFAAPFDIFHGGLAIDPVSGNLWIGSSTSRDVVEITRSGVEVRRVNLGVQGIEDAEISGLDFDAQGKLWVSSTQGVVYRVDLGLDLSQARATLAQVNAQADDGTAANAAVASANVGQVIEVMGTNFGAGTQVLFNTRDNQGVQGLAAQDPLAISADGTRLQVLVPNLAATGDIRVGNVGSARNLGFGSNGDALYRGIELSFTADDSEALVRFADGGLQGVSDESWGLDNVRITQGGASVFEDDFEGGADARWSVSGTDRSVAGIFSEFSGRHSNATQTLSLTGLTAGASYSVRFDLYVLDTWDGASASNGPDIFEVSVDGVTRFSESFSNVLTAAQTFGTSAGQRLQIVPTLNAVSSGRPGGDGSFTLVGSGFMEGASTVTVGGVARVDADTNLSEFDVSGARNDSYRLNAPRTLDGPIRVTTEGGYDEIAGAGAGLIDPVRFEGIEAVARAGVAADAGVASANTGQRIVLLGQGFAFDTQVQFSAIDEAGQVGTVTRTGSASSDGRRLEIEVPVLARTGVVRVQGDPGREIALQIVPTLRSVGGAVVSGNVVLLDGSGLVETELEIRIDGRPVGQFDVRTLVDGTGSGFIGDTDVHDQQLLTLTVPSGVGAGVISVSTSGGSMVLRTGVEIAQQAQVNPGADVGDTINTAQALGLAENARVEVVGSIGDGVAGVQDVDLYGLTLAAGDRLRVHMAQPVADMVVRVFDATGVERGQGYFYGFGQGGGEFEFTADRAGTYALGVSGSYNVTYDPVAGGGGSNGYTGGYRMEVENLGAGASRLTRIEASAVRGTPARGDVASANTGQLITLHGQGLRANEQVVFTTIDSNGYLDNVTVSPVSVAADGTRVQVEVPDTAATGRVRMRGDTAGILLQIVPTLDDVNMTQGGGFVGGALDLNGTGFIEGGVAVRFGNVAVVDSSRQDGPDVFGRFGNNQQQFIDNARISMSVPAHVPAGPISVQTVGGTSESYGVTVHGIVSTAATGTPSDPLAASVNPGGIITIAGTNLSLATEVIFAIFGSDNGRIVTPVAVNPAGTEAQVVVPVDAATGVVRVVGDQLATERLLQVVPVVEGAEVSAVNSDGTITVRLTGTGFDEGPGSSYLLGSEFLLDGNAASGPNVLNRSGIANGSVSMIVRLVDAVFGAITATTAGGTSAPFSVDLAAIAAVAPSGTPANASLPSAHAGQTITLAGRGLTTASDVLVTYIDGGGAERTLIVNPATAQADGASATLVLPAQANGAFSLRLIGSANRPVLQIVPTLASFNLVSTTLRLLGSGFVEGDATYRFLAADVTDTSIAAGPAVSSNGGIDNARVDILEGVHGLGGLRVVTDGGTSAALDLNYLYTNLGLLRDLAIDPVSGQLWVITDTNPAQVHRIDSATGASLGSFTLSAAVAGAANFYGGMQILTAPMTLNGVNVPAGSLLLMNGRPTADRIVALDPTGALIASLTLANYDITGGVYDPTTDHLFLAAYQGAQDNRVLEVSTTGTLIGSFAAPYDIFHSGLAIHPVTGNLWIGSSQSRQVVELTRAGVELRRVDLTAQGVDDAEITGLAFDVAGRLFVSSITSAVYEVSVD